MTGLDTVLLLSFLLLEPVESLRRLALPLLELFFEVSLEEFVTVDVMLLRPFFLDELSLTSFLGTLP